MDESGIEVLELVHEIIDRVPVHWLEMYYRSPPSYRIENSMSNFKDDQEKESNKSEQILENPRPMKLRKHAHGSQMKKDSGIRKRAKWWMENSRKVTFYILVCPSLTKQRYMEII